MYKKIALISIVSILILTFAGGANAQFGWLPKAGIGPDSSFYFMDKLGERIGMMFAFSAEKKAEKALNNAEERLAEAKEMGDEENAEALEKAIEGYKEQLQNSERYMEKVENKEQVAEKVASSTGRHFEVLKGVAEKLPEEAQEGINNAIESSKIGHFKALDSVSNSNPGKAAELSSKAAERRIEGIKERLEEGDGEKLEEMIQEYQKYNEGVDELKGKNKDLSYLLTEKDIGLMEKLENLEEDSQDNKEAFREIIKGFKEGTKSRVENEIRKIAEEDPEKAAKLNFGLVNSKIQKIRSEAGINEEKREECRSKCEGTCQKENTEECIGECKALAECGENEDCVASTTEKCNQACNSSTEDNCMGECISACNHQHSRNFQDNVNEIEKQYNFGEEISSIAKQAGKDVEKVKELTRQATSAHIRVLEEVMENAPEEAQAGLQRAKEASQRFQNRIEEGIGIGDTERERAEERESENGETPGTGKGPGPGPATGTGATNENCEDLCGDGECQEVVCMEVGCPCPETPESCPQDCAVNGMDNGTQSSPMN